MTDHSESAIRHLLAVTRQAFKVSGPCSQDCTQGRDCHCDDAEEPSEPQSRVVDRTAFQAVWWWMLGHQLSWLVKLITAMLYPGWAAFVWLHNHCLEVAEMWDALDEASEIAARDARIKNGGR